MYNGKLLQNRQIKILGNIISYEITICDFDINQRNDYNLSHIDFCECENLLKTFYNIDYLLIIKYDDK